MASTPDGRTSSIALRLALFFTGGLLIMGLLLLGMTAWIKRGQVQEQLGRELRKIAATAALQIDGQQHCSFISNEVVTSQEWQSLRKTLENVARANELERDHIYTFLFPGDGTCHTLNFGVMLHDKPFVGDPYSPPEANRKLIEGMIADGEPRSTEAYRDKYGTWISAFAPIFNGEGQVAGMLEVDYRLDEDNLTYLSAFTEVLRPVVILFVMAIPFGLLLSIFMAKRVNRPIQELVEVTEFTAQGNWDHPIPPVKWREINRLAVAFEAMRDTIQSQFSDLQQLNETLEEKVQDRTSDLEQVNNQLIAAQAIVASVNEMISLEQVLTRASEFISQFIELEAMSLVLPIEAEDCRTVEVLSSPYPVDSGFRQSTVTPNRNPFKRRLDEKVSDMSAWSLTARDFLPSESKSMLSIPLSMGEELIGILLLGHRGDNNFDPKHRYVFSLAVHLANAIQKSRSIHSLERLNQDLKDAQQKLKQQSEAQLVYEKTHDGFTGLGNRNYFMERAALALAEARMKKKELTILTLDIDHFIKVNENLGFAAGDRILREVTRRLQDVFGLHALSRIGSNEFSAVVSEMYTELDVVELSEELVRLIAEPFSLDRLPVHLTASVGVAQYPRDGEQIDVLVKNAALALARAKSAGGNSYKFYDKSMNAEGATRLAMENELRQAIDNNQLSLFYQPQVAIEDGSLIGFEALVRWIHPEQGMISPGRFIPLAEETGLIIPLGKWVTLDACRRIKKWLEQGLDAQPVGVNLSAYQFSQPDLVPFVASVLDETGIPPHLLELEITEGIAMDNVADTVVTLRELKAMGITIAIDDFGTGYSSLSYLKQFDLDRLKIDKSFVDGLPDDEEDRAIVTAIIDMGHALGLKVIAEGVEHGEQRDFLQSRGCDEVQGYFFSKPLPEDQARERLSQHSTV